jgi:hypothetical protein
MIIRHAEKPGSKKHRPPDGVNIQGAIDENSLIVQGWQRAGAIAELFAPHSGVFENVELAQPNLIYASGTITDKSLRPQETITPLANKLGIKPNTDFNPSKTGDAKNVQHEKDLIKNALTQAGVVLISWQHELIPTIASYIPLTQGTTYPSKWCSDRFDLVWVFDLASNTPPAGPLYNFTQVPQNLLAGDLDAPMQDPCPSKDED